MSPPLAGRRPRRGSMLLEAAGATALMGVAIVLAVQVLAWTAAERRESAHNAWARQEAINLVERLRGTPPGRLEAAIADLNRPDGRAARFLPGGRVAIRLADAPGDLPGKRLTVEVAWTGRGGRPAPPARLTTFVFPIADKAGVRP
ncbi:MAG: hypothetical protein U0800_14645 [Isosphaeraceae bacterium]